MVATLIDHNPTERSFRKRPMLVVELVGPACAGKTTLTRTLTQCMTTVQVAPDISVRRLRHLAIFLRDAPLLFPVLLSGCQNSQWFSWEDIKSMVYLQGWPRILRRLAANNHSAVLLDQGPVFRLALLHAYGPFNLSKPIADRWWEDLLQQWASLLDLVVWLDAPNPILVNRINARNRWHLVKGKSEQEASQFLDRYRASYDRVLTQLSANGGPRIIAFDTSQVSIGQMVNGILTACNAVLDGG